MEMNLQFQQDKEALDRVVLAGMKIMYDEKAFQVFKQGMLRPGPLPDKLATEAAGLVKIIDEKSKPHIPRQLVVPAATMLLIEMASFVKQAKVADPTEDDIHDALQKLLVLLAKIFGGQAAPSAPAAQPAAKTGQPAAPQPGLMGA